MGDDRAPDDDGGPGDRSGPRKRRGVLAPILAVLLALACLAALVGGAKYFDDRNNDDHDTGASASTSTQSSSSGSGTASKAADARVALVRGFCADDRALGASSGVVGFKPGTGAVAYVQLPQPASSTEPAGSRVVQVSPIVGKPNLSLAKSINLVSLAACVDERASAVVPGTCDYDLTNPSSVGTSATAKLVKTSYRVRLIEMRTGKTLTSGTIATPTDACPAFAFIGGDGVSNPLTDTLILKWVGQHLPAGHPR